MCVQSFTNFNIAVFAGGRNMKQLQIRVDRAILSDDKRKRDRAVNWFDRHGKIDCLVSVMDNSRYEDTRLRAQDALSKYSFK